MRKINDSLKSNSQKYKKKKSREESFEQTKDK